MKKTTSGEEGQLVKTDQVTLCHSRCDRRVVLRQRLFIHTHDADDTRPCGRRAVDVFGEPGAYSFRVTVASPDSGCGL
ncbi:MAG: hypothetical protein CME24_03820 [Gemmatimonadetes bacterium]|nr:hypothetical protein [Gemmatimonadota bacterium]